MTLPFALSPTRILAAVAGLAAIGLLIWALWLRGDLEVMTRLRGEERAAHQQTKDNFTGAMAEAKRLNTARVLIVEREQSRITQEVSHEYQIRLAAARAVADRLRREAANRALAGRAGAGPVPASGAAPGGPDAAAEEDRLPVADALTATEQALQLDALIDWVERQAKVDVEGRREAVPVTVR